MKYNQETLINNVYAFVERYFDTSYSLVSLAPGIVTCRLKKFSYDTYFDPVFWTPRNPEKWKDSFQQLETLEGLHVLLGINRSPPPTTFQQAREFAHLELVSAFSTNTQTVRWYSAPQPIQRTRNI